MDEIEYALMDKADGAMWWYRCLQELVSPTRRPPAPWHPPMKWRSAAPIVDLGTSLSLTRNHPLPKVVARPVSPIDIAEQGRGEREERAARHATLSAAVEETREYRRNPMDSPAHPAISGPQPGLEPAVPTGTMPATPEMLEQALCC